MWSKMKHLFKKNRHYFFIYAAIKAIINYEWSNVKMDKWKILTESVDHCVPHIDFSRVGYPDILMDGRVYLVSHFNNVDFYLFLYPMEKCFSCVQPSEKSFLFS